MSEGTDLESAEKLRYSHVRVYVSSVFQDKHFERQILSNLSSHFRKLCDSFGLQFQIIDLRFGMGDEVINDILVSQLCRQEVAYSREISLGPSLVILAGMRYGYRCLPENINKKEAIRLVASMDAPKAKALFQDWFRIDTNSLTKDFTIVPISSRFPHFFSADANLIGQKLEERNEWLNEIHVVGRSIRRAAKTVYKDDKLKINSFTSSVFECEIVEGLLNHPGNPNEHCLCYKTRIIDINKFLRSHDSVAKYIDMIPGTKEVDQEAQKALNALKELKIPQTENGIETENIFEHILVFGQDLIDTNKSETFKEYLTDFEKELKCSITNLIIGCSKNISDILSSRLSNEIETHLRYAKNMSELKSGFLSVTDKCVSRINSYIESAEHLTPLVLFGEQGVGKSAVISRIVTGLSNSTANSHFRLVVRFIGLTLEAESICTLLRSICQQLLSILGLTNQRPPSAYPELKAFFHQLVREPTNQKFVIMLDGVDYLDNSDNGASADWLPKCLPPNARLIISTRPEVSRLTLSGARSVLQGTRATFLELTPIPESELSQFLSAFLSAHNRKMTSSQFQIVLGFMRSSNCVTPFYTSLLLKDAGRWKSFSRVNQSEFSVTVNGMLHSIFAKLEQKYSHLFVSECLSIITVARYGVTECELGDIISSNLELKQELTHNSTNQTLSPIFWARLKSELTFPFLVHVMAPGSYCVVKWGHSIFRTVAQQRYLSSPDRIMHFHKILSEYFQNSKLRNLYHPLPDAPSNHNGSEECTYLNPRNLLELSLNLVETGQSRLLIGLLTDLEWVRLKIESVGVSEVLRDFTLLFDLLPHSEESDLIGQLRVLQEAVASCYDPIGQNPKCLAQKMASHLMAFVFQSEPNGTVKLRNPKIDTKYALLIGYFRAAVNSLTPPNLIPMSPSNGRIGSEFVYQLCNHFGAITCIRIKDTNDKKGMLLMTSSDDYTIRLWDLKLGKLLLVLVGHGKGVKSCDMSTGANVAISGCEDATIRIWDLKNANCLQEMNGHSGPVNSVRLTKNGRLGISGGSDGNICLWNCHRESSCFGDLIYTLHAHSQPIRSLTLTENEQLLLSGSDDNTVKLWNVASSSNCGTIEGHSGPIVSVSVLETIILTSSSDGTVKSWSKNRLSLIQTFPANSYSINSVSLAHSNGVIGLVACSSGTILVIDPKTGICKNSIDGHSCGVTCVAMAPNGIWGVSGDENGTLKVWTIGRDLFLAGTGTSATHRGVIGRIRFSPCEQFLATVGVDGYVSVLELESSKVELSLKAHSQPISDVVIHKDSLRFLTAGEDRVLKLWHGETTSSLAEFRGHSSPISSVAITQEGELIGSGDKKGNIFIWKLDNPEWYLEFPSELTQPISELQFIYRNNIVYLLCGCQDGSLTLWNVEKACLVSRFDTFECVTCLDTISHEWQAISGTQGGSITKWSLDTTEPLNTHPSVHKDRVSSVRYLNKLEPYHIVSSGYDGYIHLTELESLVSLASFCVGDSITSVDANLIGSLVAFATANGVVGMVGVSSDSAPSGGLFERGPFLFRQDSNVELLGEYTQSYPTLLENLDNENDLLEFAEKFAVGSEPTNEIPELFSKDELAPIFLVPRRQGALPPITERSEEEENGTNMPPNSGRIRAPENPVKTKNSNNGEQITSKICNIL